MYQGRKIHTNLQVFKIKFTYVTNDAAKASIKNYIIHYTTPCGTVICDSDGVAYCTNRSNSNF
jgi:hypothetical protein